MNRYFFDVATNSSMHYDYKGRELERPDQARDMAELIALDIECIDGDNSSGAEVQVRNAGGQKLFTISIRDCSLQAA